MSVTPMRPCSAAQSTRRVSFSLVVKDALDVAELHPAQVADYGDDVSAEHSTDAPSTTSHRTRLAMGNSPTRRLSVDSRGTTPTTAAMAGTTTVEFSLKDIPLEGNMAAPIWREPSPGRSHSSRRASPARGTPSSARLSHANHNDAPTITTTTTSMDPPSAARQVNPYTDVARDSANTLRRQRVVRTFFESHEDAVRLYIRLQQLLTYRETCHAEFQQRLQFLNSDEERERAVAARAQRMALQEQEIQRIQAALATADVSSPEFASSMNSLYSNNSGTPSERSARRDAEPRPRGHPLLGRGLVAAHGGARGPSNASVPTTSEVSPRPLLRRSNVTEGEKKRLAAARPPSSPRHASPREALEAWRRSRSQDHPASSASISLEGNAPMGPGHGVTPRDGVLSSDMEGSHRVPDCSAPPRAMAIVVPVCQDASPPLLPPRLQTAPMGNSSRNAPSPHAPPLTRREEKVNTSSSLPTSMLPGTPSSSVDAAKRSPSRAATAGTRPAPSARPLRTTRVPLPLSPSSPDNTSSSRPAVGGLVTPPQSVRPLRLTSLSRASFTPDRRASPASSQAVVSLTDSPLARFRKQQGYADPIQHFRARLSNSATPLRSQSSLGSVRRSPMHGRTPPASLASQPSSSMEPRQEEAHEQQTTAAAATKHAKKAGEEGQPATDRVTALLRACERKASRQNASATPERSFSPRTAPSHTTPSTTGAKAPMVIASGTSGSRTPELQSRSSSFSPGRRAAPPKSVSARQPPLTATTSALQEKPAPSRLKSASPPFAEVQDTAPKDVRSWSPISPPEHDVKVNTVAQIGLVSSSVKPSRSSSEPAQRDDVAEGGTMRSGSQAPNTTTTANANTPAAVGNAVWDDIAALERRVGGLEGRTAELERNAAKRAVLDAIRLLRERVTLLEDRTTSLERVENGGLFQ